ncbi:helix-turn-helix domain-containing protein [Deinococcus murrayi]|uniref:helix-turn-helix domain-containing protein n=1 Tax=Deinococcus murrayi TaxID=68910 RepID=UPI0006858DB1|nr:helix-turn-helix transcriptional regulator [Deinococcus murrayi]
MNEEIRAAVDARLREKGLSRADLARATGIHPNHITRALNNTGGRGGNVPPVWQAILDALGLTLTAVPVEHLSSGGVPPAPSDPQALEREVMRRVQAAVREALGSVAPPQGDEPGRAGGGKE